MWRIRSVWFWSTSATEAKTLLAQKEGTLFPMQLTSGREVIVMVPTVESEARKSGHDVYFRLVQRPAVETLQMHSEMNCQLAPNQSLPGNPYERLTFVLKLRADFMSQVRGA